MFFSSSAVNNINRMNASEKLNFAFKLREEILFNYIFVAPFLFLLMIGMIVGFVFGSFSVFNSGLGCLFGFSVFLLYFEYLDNKHKALNYCAVVLNDYRIRL